MIIAKRFEVVLEGDRFPVQFNPGQTCPAELIEQAKALGAFDEGDAPAAPAEPAPAPKAKAKD